MIFFYLLYFIILDDSTVAQNSLFQIEVKKKKTLK